MIQFDARQLLQAANLHDQQGELPRVEIICLQILAVSPKDTEALHLLGNTVGRLGRISEAIQLLEQAVAINPRDAGYHINLGVWLAQAKQHVSAIACFQRGLRISPHHPKGYFNLGCSLQAEGRFDEAAAAYQRESSLQPSHVGTKINLGNIMALTGNAESAIHLYRQALAIAPDHAAWHGNMIYAMLFHPGYNASALRNELSIWNTRFAKPLAGFMRPHSNERNPHRPLKIGYVSPDFRNHVVGLNMIPLFRHHDAEHFEIHCFANVAAPDHITAEFQRLSRHYYDISRLSDERAAELIRAAGIDILIDLSLHLGGNRLLIFARKPAPVQVTFAGYPGSTGLDAIDYRLTDPHLDPPGNNDDAYCETSFRLPKTFWCFDPAANSLDSAPAVNSLPASHLGPVTFGCLNNFRKINEVTLKLWGKVLSGVPESRMILLTQEGSHRQWVCDILAKFGIASDRLIFEPMRSRADYLHLYHHIDIALDTLPYNGHSTSLDSFYMGVPVITMVGQTVVGRAGVSQLMNLGMPELIAHTEEDFVQIAASLAGNLKALAAMREGLRARMEGSPLMDAPAFARHIESAYRKMWQDWCAGQAVHPSSVASER